MQGILKPRVNGVMQDRARNEEIWVVPKVSCELLIEVIFHLCNSASSSVKGISNSVFPNLLEWWDSNEEMNKETLH